MNQLNHIGISLSRILPQDHSTTKTKSNFFSGNICTSLSRTSSCTDCSGQRPLGAPIKLQTNSYLPHVSPSHPQPPRSEGWNFLLMACCKRLLSIGKATLKMSKTQSCKIQKEQHVLKVPFGKMCKVYKSGRLGALSIYVHQIGSLKLTMTT